MPKASHGKREQKPRKKVTFSTDVEKQEIMREARKIKLEDSESGEEMDTLVVRTCEKAGESALSTGGPAQKQARIARTKPSTGPSTMSKDCTVKEESKSVAIRPTARSKQKVISSRPDVKLRRLKSIPDILKELYVIWEKDNRVPTADSRREWAHARGVQPERVGQWFSNRKRKAMQAGKSCEGTYSLDVNAPYTENKENVAKTEDERASATFNNAPSETLTTTSVRQPLEPRSTPNKPVLLGSHSPPSTPSLSFGLSSPRSSSPVSLSLPLLVLPVPTIIEKTVPPSEMLSSSDFFSQTYDLSTYTQPMNVFNSRITTSRSLSTG